MKPDQAASDQAIRFYQTANYACSYLPTEQARSIVAADTIDNHTYSQLINMGFRRSGLHVYRPHCDLCHACLSARIPVEQFRPNRTQSRIMRRLADMTLEILPLTFNLEHYQLYCRYQQARHAETTMAEDGIQQYSDFILSSQVHSQLLSFKLAGELKMVSLIDQVEDGYSAVYTFYDPDQPQLSLGVFNVLKQIQLVRQQQLPYLYLGYWIANCRKMAYKANYRPLQLLENGQWRAALSTKL